MNKQRFLEDRVIVQAALTRIITVRDIQVTNIDFAFHLFFCATDMLPFKDALTLYGYKKSDFSKEVVGVFKDCYNVGNSHIKRAQTTKMLSDEECRKATYELLERIWGLYARPKEEEEDKEYIFTIRDKDSRHL